MTKSIRYPCQGRRTNIMYNLKTVTTMLEHEIKNKVLTIGNRKGQTVYYAYPKSQQKLTNGMVVERIVRETSLSEGDVKNALVSLSNVVCEALQLGMSVDLAELGNLRVSVPSKMMDTKEEVTAKDALKTPKIVFTPKQKMRDAANAKVGSISISNAIIYADGGGDNSTLNFIYNHAAPRLWRENYLFDFYSLFGDISVPCGTCGCPKPLLLQAGLRRTCFLQPALCFHTSPNRKVLPLLSACSLF